jgi:hypothetical protein
MNTVFLLRTNVTHSNGASVQNAPNLGLLDLIGVTMSNEGYSRYHVRLNGYPQLPRRDRLIVEARFCSKVESLLGSVKAVINGYKAFCTASPDNLEGPIVSENDWIHSVQIARMTALRGIPMRDDCYFEISVPNSDGKTGE